MPKNQAAVELGRLGAAATNRKHTAAERSAIARKAALARWNNKPSPPSHKAKRKQAAA